MAIVNEGLNYVLGVTFSDDTQDATHYIGLKSTGSVAAGDTLASHAGWTEITDYTGDRKAWTEGGASSQSISNSGNAAAFAINGTCNVYGAFLCVPATGSAQELVAAVDFTTNRSLADGDTLNVTYTLTAADDGA